MVPRSSFQPITTRKKHLFNLIEPPADVVVIGHLKIAPAVKGKTTTVILESRFCRSSHDRPLQHCKGDVLLRMQFPWPGFPPGTLLAARTTLRRPGKFRTPGSFDYPAYLARKDIWLTGFLRSPALIAPIDKNNSLQSKIYYLPERIRMYLSQFLTANLNNPEQRTIYQALLLGERTDIPDYLYEQYRASGLAHILAISGIHVSILGLLLYLFWYRLLCRSTHLILRINIKKTAILLTLLPLIFYSSLAGTGNPVIRACIMALVAGVASCTDRIKSIPNLIAFAALILLVISPQNLFTVSFQLSFAAVVSITINYPLMKRIYRLLDNRGSNRTQVMFFSACKWLVTGFLTSCAAVLGTAPLVIYHFNRFSLPGPLANLIVEPLLCLWALPIGFIALLFVKILPIVSVVLLQTGGLGITAANNITCWIASVPGHNLWLPSPALPHITLYYCLFLVIPYVIQKRRWVGYLLCSLFVFSFTALLIPLRLPTAALPTATSVEFLDVGQGSATVIRLKDGKTILIDAGGSSWSTPSIGERVLAPYLWKQGITKIHTIIITHPDSDHYDGLPFIIRHFRPKYLWTSTLETRESGYRNLLEICKKKEVVLHQAKANDTIHFGTTILKCLINLHSSHGQGEGNSGLVLRLNTADISILFPGDIEANAERKLLNLNLPLRSDILLAAHHGSKTSNTPAFLKAVNPAAIIVSAGKTKARYYPSPALKRTGKQKNIPIYSTHTAGTLLLGHKNGLPCLFSYGQVTDNPLHRKTLEQEPVQLFN